MVMVTLKEVSTLGRIVINISMIPVGHIQLSSQSVMSTHEHLVIPVVKMYKYNDVVMEASMALKVVKELGKHNVRHDIFVVRVIVSKSSLDHVEQSVVLPYMMQTTMEIASPEVVQDSVLLVP